MCKKEFNFGVVGCGTAGQDHISGLQKGFTGQPYAICDINEETLSKVSKKFSIERTTTDYKELVSMPDVDIVIIAVPLVFHKEVLLKAAKNKKHILCEKPYALNAKDAKQMNDAAAANKDKLLAVNYTLRHSELYSELKKQVQEGAIGNPISFTVDVSLSGTGGAPYYPRNRLTVVNMTQNMGPAYESAAHYIDGFYYIFDKKFSNVSANACRVEKEFELPGIVFISGTDEKSDMLVSLRMSWVNAYKSLNPPPCKFEFEIVGDEGVLSWEMSDSILSIRRSKSSEVEERKVSAWDVNEVAAFSTAHKELVESIELGRLLPTLGSPEAGLLQSSVSAKAHELVMAGNI
ncbi:MAG: Gfo/Idh/MocA family oxidoreductase [Planctomycetota bacterium]